MSNTFIEINVFEEDGAVAYSAVLDDHDDPVVLCDGSTNTRQQACEALIATLRKTIR